jgi:hypothetical protein
LPSGRPATRQLGFPPGAWQALATGAHLQHD